MITINNQKKLLSELVQAIKDDHDLTWEKAYDNYLIKLNGQSFADLAALVTRLKEYLDKEKEDHLTNPQIATRRGLGSSANSAMTLPPVKRSKVNSADVAAINLLCTTGSGAGITNKQPHTTDPETGRPKAGGVTVSEFYINGADGRRATMRTEGAVKSFYYSDNHVESTYKYARLIAG
jgi:hypothetical protein